MCIYHWMKAKVKSIKVRIITAAHQCEYPLLFLTIKPSDLWEKLFVIHNIVTLFVIHSAVHNFIYNTKLWHFKQLCMVIGKNLALFTTTWAKLLQNRFAKNEIKNDVFVQCKCSLKRQRIKWVALWDQATQVVHLIKHIYRHVYLAEQNVGVKLQKRKSSVVSQLHPSIKYICDFRYDIGLYAISFTVDRVVSSCLFFHEPCVLTLYHLCCLP